MSKNKQKKKKKVGEVYTRLCGQATVGHWETREREGIASLREFK